MQPSFTLFPKHSYLYQGSLICLKYFTSVPICASPGTVHILPYKVLPFRKMEALQVKVVQKSRQQAAACWIFTCLSHFGRRTRETWYHLSFPLGTHILNAHTCTHTHTQIYAPICNMEEHLDLTIQPKTSLGFITTKVKLSKHKLI